MIAQSTGFRGRTPSPSPSELDDLILLELAVRDQARLDERRRPIDTQSRLECRELNVRQIVAHEGWQVAPADVDQAVQRLTSLDLMSLDRSPACPGADGCGAKLWPEGHARAAAVARGYLGEPLRSFVPDDEMFDGMGQIAVEFLGDRFVLGCVEGEEDRAIRFAHRLEVDGGGVLEAVPGNLDHTRAMLMAGILAHERIDDLVREAETVPASDRVVGLDHNAAEYVETITTVETLIIVVRESNSYQEEDAPDQERRLAELEAGRTLLKSRWVSPTTVRAAFWGTLVYLASKFADAPIGDAATAAWSALKQLFGIR